MALTITLTYAGHNRLRYRLEAAEDGESASLECDGGVSPDLLTDSLAGPIKDIAKVKAQGYGQIPVGGITTPGQAIALLQSGLGFASPITFGIKPTLITRIMPRSGGPNWTVIGVRGPSDTATPGLTITNNTGGAAVAYLEIELPGSIGA